MHQNARHVHQYADCDVFTKFVGCRKEEYQSGFGLALLFDRSGGKLTPEMVDVLEREKEQGPHAERLMAEVRRRWDEWDMREDSTRDDMLMFDTFYNAFMAPYFSCYRCNDTHKALQVTLYSFLSLVFLFNVTCYN